MPRRALIVGAAAGPGDESAGVLQRFGFGAPEQVASLEQLFERLHEEHFDLVMLPLQVADARHFALIEREIRATPTTFFIGTAAERDPDLILRAMRAGVHEFLVSPPDPKELSAAVDRILRRLPSEGQRGKVVAVYSAKGGLGNSTIAVNLAHALAKANADGRVALADLVIGGGDIRVLLNLSPSYDLGSLVQKMDRIDADVLNSVLTPYSGGLWVLPSPEDPEYEEVLDGGAMSTIIEHLRTHFAFSVLDCEHHLSERTLAVLDAADHVLLVSQLSVPALRSTQRTLALCQRLGYPEERLCVVLNRFQSGEVLNISDATAVLKRDVYWKLPNDYKTTTGALARGIPIAEHDPASKLTWSFTQLAAKLGGGTTIHTNGAHSAREASRLKRLFGMGKRG